MALQLAWYRTRRFFTATYETALTRLFQHGRTETIRTLSADSRAWVLAMEDPSASVRLTVSPFVHSLTFRVASPRLAPRFCEPLSRRTAGSRAPR